MSSSFNIINRTGPPVSNSTSQYNSSTREQDLLPYELYQIPQAFIIIIVCLYGIIVFVSIGGNLVVCYTVFTVQRLRTVTNFFLASLSVSDMLMTVFCIPFTVMSNIIYHYWPFWGWMCPLVQYLQLVSVLQRAFTMVAIACDRHFVISKPLKKRISKAKARVMITLFWILAMLAAIPTAVYSKIVYLQYEPGSRGLCVEVWHDHESRYIYSVTIMMLQYFLPLFIMLCTYTHIGYMIWIKRPPGEADSSRDLRIASSKRKVKYSFCQKLLNFEINGFFICIFIGHSLKHLGFLRVRDSQILVFYVVYRVYKIICFVKLAIVLPFL